MKTTMLQDLVRRLAVISELLQDPNTRNTLKDEDVNIIVHTLKEARTRLSKTTILVDAVTDELYYRDRKHEKLRLRQAVLSLLDPVDEQPDIAAARDAHARLTKEMGRQLNWPSFPQGVPATEEPPHAGVVCSIHGHVDLPQADYEKQIQHLNRAWICPRCTAEKVEGAAVVLDWRRTDELLRYRMKART